MTINLTEVTKGSVGPFADQISIIVGENEETISSAVNLVLMTLMGGLWKKASTHGGIEDVFQILDNHDGSIVENLPSMLRGGNHTGLLEMSDSVLLMLFEHSRQTIISQLAASTRISGEKIGTLLGLLAPIAIGVVGRERRTRDLDAPGVKNLLMSQNEYLTSQLDPRVSESPETGELHEPRAVVPSEQSAASSSLPSSPVIQTRVPEESSGSWLLSLLPLVILAALAYWAYQAFDTNQPAAAIDIQGFDSEYLSDRLASLTTEIDRISSVESAQALLPKLGEATDYVEGLNLTAIANGPNKDAVGKFLNPLVAKLKTAVERAYGIPGVKSVLEPVIHPLLAKFAPLESEN